MVPQQLNAERRFGGLNRLYGEGSIDRLQAAHIMIAGIGGVGSWCVEALARSGVGQLTLIDLDHVSESNINRQLPALSSTLGQAKVQAMRTRIAEINPDCVVNVVDDFIGPDNVSQLLAVRPDVLIDCTDQAEAKIAMILEAKRTKTKVFICGAAGGKTNALALKRGDLSLSTHDALLAKIRNKLRKEYGFAKVQPKQNQRPARTPKMGVDVFWVEQNALLPSAWQADSLAQTPQGLSCAGYGSIVTVTAPMGFAAAQAALDYVLAKR